MELGEFYPKPDELIRRELAVLAYLRDQPYIKDKHPQFAQHAANYFGRNKGAQAGFEFFSWLDVLHSEKKTSYKAKPNMRLVIGALIERQDATYQNVSYCLAVCSVRSNAVRRKFHFDITANSKVRKQPHPRCHLQYGGEMIPEMETIGVRSTQLKPLYPSLSEPRIFSPPVSLALLLDMTLHEFPDFKSEKFRAAPEWQSIIRTHEDVVLRPFFEKCLEVIKYHDENRKTLADAFYVS